MPRQIYEIGPFVADPEVRVLMRGGEVIPLTPKAFDVLLALIRAGGAPVSREELMRAVWGDSAVEDANLTNAIWVLRKALGEDNGQSRHIVTIPRRGYRLAAHVVQRIDTDPKLSIREICAHPQATQNGASRRRWSKIVWSAIPVAATLLASVLYYGRTPSPRQLRYEQITYFPGSVGSPTLSRDGRMLAFVGCDVSGPPLCPGQLYLKLLPGGEPIALTRSAAPKGMPAFSPDGSRVAFTTDSWSTWTVPLPSGAPFEFLPWAAGLSWMEPGRLLYSRRTLDSSAEIRWSIVTGDENASETREIYRSPSRYGILHFPTRSPDGKWILFGELDLNGWLPCRLIPFQGKPAVQEVGPAGSQCTSAAWSPDGRWMYFVAALGGVSHIWRQRFPAGEPEQLTSGPMEEAGLAVSPDGQSLITAAGLAQSSVWIRDSSGERQISQEGYAFRPSISPDGRRVFYLIRQAVRRPTWLGELWSADLRTGRRERVLMKYLVSHFDVSRDGATVVFDAVDDTGNSRVWIASTERRFAPRLLSRNDTSSSDRRPFFGASGDVYFLREERHSPRYVYRVKLDGSSPAKAYPDPVLFLVNVAPNGKWVIAWNSLPSDPRTRGLVALPIGGGEPAPLCSCSAGPIWQESPLASWTKDAKHLLIGRPGPPGGSVVLPIDAESMLPGAPHSPVLSWKDLAGLPGARMITERSVSPGESAGIHAFTRSTAHQNLYRIYLPD